MYTKSYFPRLHSSLAVIVNSSSGLFQGASIGVHTAYYIYHVTWLKITESYCIPLRKNLNLLCFFSKLARSFCSEFSCHGNQIWDLGHPSNTLGSLIKGAKNVCVWNFFYPSWFPRLPGVKKSGGSGPKFQMLRKLPMFVGLISHLTCDVLGQEFVVRKQLSFMKSLIIMIFHDINWYFAVVKTERTLRSAGHCFLQEQLDQYDMLYGSIGIDKNKHTSWWVWITFL